MNDYDMSSNERRTDSSSSGYTPSPHTERYHEVQVTHEQGLHARPASEIAKASGRYKSEITLIHLGTTPNKRVNGKSIIEVLLLGAPIGTGIGIHAIGPDAEEAVGTLATLF